MSLHEDTKKEKKEKRSQQSKQRTWPGLNLISNMSSCTGPTFNPANLSDWFPWGIH